MYHLRVPQTAEELDMYYQFRWEMLRKPLRQPQGSERDGWDANGGGRARTASSGWTALH